jgi:hypothetical protein
MHIVKLCVGADSVADLFAWQAQQILTRGRPVCGTRQTPSRGAEVVASGSLYWVIKGAVLVRQRIVEIGEVEDEHGLRCGLWLDPDLVSTVPQPRRAFQGWRYLDPADAPADIGSGCAGGRELPETLRRELMALGAW